MLLAPLICCSSGAAIDCETTSAFAPGKVAETCTCGGTICGYCEIGSSNAATAPAKVMISEMTVEKTGRSMKKLNMLRFPLGADSFAGTLAGGASGAASVGVGVAGGWTGAALSFPAGWSDSFAVAFALCLFAGLLCVFSAGGGACDAADCIVSV